MRYALLSPRDIEVPDYVERPLSKMRDELLLESIRAGGIQQPLVLVDDGGRLLLAKGLRRLRAAITLGIKVPVQIDTPPAGTTAEAHIRKVRFHLVEHVQDLKASQRARFIADVKERFHFTNEQAAAYLAIRPDTLTNYLAPLKYIAPVVGAMDAELLTMQAARVFDGMSDEGQAAVWKAHGRELMTESGAGAHKRIRGLYPPETFPSYYRNATVIASRLARPSGKRKSRPRTGEADKSKLMRSFELDEIALREREAELKEKRRQIDAARQPITVLMRDEKLVARLSPAMREQLEFFVDNC